MPTVIAAMSHAPTDLAPASKGDSFSYVHGPGIDDHRSRGQLGGDCHRQPSGRDEQERTSQWITELGLYDYRNRVYSAELGRFLQTDPIQFEAGDVNLYRYVKNNSINKIDPLGLACCNFGDCFRNCLEANGAWGALGVIGISAPAVSVPYPGNKMLLGSKNPYTNSLRMVGGNALKQLGRRLNPIANAAAVGAAGYLAALEISCAIQCGADCDSW
jgi:RHS repeat-associated protein